jgi:hypothetical protein
LPVLHYRPRGPAPSVVVEFPDGSARRLPWDWTDRGANAPADADAGRLSGLALLEIVRLLEAWHALDVR